MVDGDDPVQVKFECKEVESTPCENYQAVYISHHNFGTVIDSEKSPINADRKKVDHRLSNEHQPRSCVTPNFSKMGLDTQTCRFFAESSTKNH